MGREGVEMNAVKNVEKTYFEVPGLCCASEVGLIEKVLESLDGIESFSVIVATKTLIVFHDSAVISKTEIVNLLNRERLEANVRPRGATTFKSKWPTPFSVASGLLLLLSLLKYVYSPLQWLAVGAIAAGLPPIVMKAIAAVGGLRLDINILLLITVAGSVALHDYWEAGTIVFLFTVSEWLESRASHKATAVMSSLVNLMPQRAVLAQTGEDVDANEVALNSVLAVKAGEVIPIDGVVLEGNCEVDEKFLTGESFPVAKQAGSAVWASTINVNGYVSVMTTAVAADCVVARMANIVEEAQERKSPTQRLMDKCAKYYTPAIVAISALIAIVPLAFPVWNKSRWYHLALVILVSGCPCALLLSTPVAVFCALSKAARLGILFKGADHLENLARIKTIALDKTGTITRGEFVVAEFKPRRDDIPFDTLLQWISSIESKSSHPMADALVEYARSYRVEPRPDSVDKFQNFPGEGICGIIEKNEIYIGNSKIASRAGCTAVPELEGFNLEGKSIGYVFLGASLAGIFCLSDTCRTGAKEAIEELKSLGVKTAMLTGDCRQAANCTQEQLGDALDVIHAELLPQDKASIIQTLQNDGLTAMIGDGVNDAPALATADIGISMGISGSALAQQSGNIILMTNDIRRIPEACRIAKKVKLKIIQNVIASLSTKAAIIGLAIAGHPLVWAAVLADVGTCLLVIFNSMLLLRGTTGPGKTTCQSTHNSPCGDVESHNCAAGSCSLAGSSSGHCGDNKCSTAGKEGANNVQCCQQSKATLSYRKCCHKAAHNTKTESTQSHGCSKHATCGEKSGRHEHNIFCRLYHVYVAGFFAQP